MQNRSRQYDSYYEYLSDVIKSLNIDTENINAIFVHRGKYSVRVFKDVTFDEAVERLLKYNKSSETAGRCIMIKAPNVLLRTLHELRPVNAPIGPMPKVKSMITYCAPMNNPVREPMKSGFKGIIGDEYLIPDRRQDAADMVSENDDLVSLADSAMNMQLVELDGKTPFEGAPY